MARGRTERVMARRLGADGAGALQPDEVIVEEPLEIRLDDRLVATTMRTPGHDYELAVGFCFSEGLLAGAPVQTVRYCATGSAVDTEFNVVSVDTGGQAPAPTPRVGNTTSSCGWCGSMSVDALADRLAPVSPIELRADTLAAVSAAVRADQGLFEVTGGVHAAAVFDPVSGEVLAVREDIGRHNAVDKLLGRRLLDGGLPAVGLALWVSGRASFELVQKAWAGGFGALAAVSAPSALAVATARRAGLTLVGFARGNDAVLY